MYVAERLSLHGALDFHMFGQFRFYAWKKNYVRRFVSEIWLPRKAKYSRQLNVLDWTLGKYKTTHGNFVEENIMYANYVSEYTHTQSLQQSLEKKH